VWGWGRYVHPHIHTQSMQGFSIKTGTDLDNTYGDKLFIKDGFRMDWAAHCHNVAGSERYLLFIS